MNYFGFADSSNNKVIMLEYMPKVLSNELQGDSQYSVLSQSGSDCNDISVFLLLVSLQVYLILLICIWSHYYSSRMEDMVKICEQIASAVIKVHKKQHIIVDLKLENILLDQYSISLARQIQMWLLTLAYPN